ncbi:MAG: acyl-CoA thioesterase [Planctomycetaceae bacterium]|nr:acyl-CoA thioesterase [Planctomycetaceae bacterium]
MNPLVSHFANGQAFFTGALLVMFALTGLGFSRRQKPSEESGNDATPREPTAGFGQVLAQVCFRYRWLLLIAGLLFVAASSTPFPIWILIPLALSTSFAWRTRDAGQRRNLVLITFLCWTTAIVHELYWQWEPSVDIEAIRGRALVVLADSVTAGLGEGEATTWPVLLQERWPSEIIDLSHVGETVITAADRFRKHSVPKDAAFIIELGGNDLLGSTTVSQFRKDLDDLLYAIRRDDPERAILMFELPLPPFHNAWGDVQRSLALRHGVVLIPKRKLLSVFTADAGTFDSIHLTQDGHNRMATIMAKLLQLR